MRTCSTGLNGSGNGRDLSLMRRSSKNRGTAFALAKARYEAMGVDVDGALAILDAISISLQCWQGDDVRGFEERGAPLGGGLAVTGSYPGRARNPEELRGDVQKALSMVPGIHRLALHASYGEFNGRGVDRDEVAPEHFTNWVSWARGLGIALDFNSTYFAHPLAESGFTLAHPDPRIREFWIEHGRRSREIGAAFGRSQGTPCVTNLWIPDGWKDVPADRRGPRERLVESLDAIFKKRFPEATNRDSVEPKLFGLGSESYVAGSYDFYLGYAVSRRKMLCLDTGHFHPTENIADKLSAVMPWLPGVLLHVSRGVRWDSDHVVTYQDSLVELAQELARNDYLGTVRLGLDYFDASINRVAAWVIGARAFLKAILTALLEPAGELRRLELAGDLTGRLALLEEAKQLPWGAVWEHHCERRGVPPDREWLRDVKRYEESVLLQRA